MPVDRSADFRTPDHSVNGLASPTEKHESLAKFVIVAPRHLNHVNREWRLHYNRERPHSARRHLSPDCEAPPEANVAIRLREVVCHTRRGGLLKSYERRAA